MNRVRSRSRGWPAGAAGWTPADLTGIKQWSRPLSLGADTTPVAQWDDESGLGNHWVQPTAGNRPVVQANALDGNSAVAFAGVDEYLQVSFGETLTQPTFIAAIYKQPATINRFLCDGQGPTARHAIWRTGAGSGLKVSLFAGSTLSEPGDTAAGTWLWIYALFNGASSQIRSPNGTTNGNAGTHSIPNLYLGAAQALASFADTACCEWILANAAPSAEEITNLGAYLDPIYPSFGNFPA